MMVSHNNDLQITYNAWVVWHGIRAHFTRDYDYFKYNGKGNWANIDSMQRSFAKVEQYGKYSGQRKLFHNIGKAFTNKESLIFFYLSQFTNGLDHPIDFDSDLYEDYRDRMNNFDTHIRCDIECIVRFMKKEDCTFNKMFITRWGTRHPHILKLVLGHVISLETFTVLDMILNFIPEMDKNLDDPIWEDHKKLVLNYKPFLEVDIDKQKKIIMDVLKKG